MSIPNDEAPKNENIRLTVYARAHELLETPHLDILRRFAENHYLDIHRIDFSQEDYIPHEVVFDLAERAREEELGVFLQESNIIPLGALDELGITQEEAQEKASEFYRLMAKSWLAYARNVKS